MEFLRTTMVEKLGCDLRFNLKSIWAAFIGSAIDD